MNPIEPGVAFGAGKAGMGFDAIKFISTPQVILQSLCLVSLLIHLQLKFNSLQMIIILI
jgi:hypothetical protein